MLTAIGARLGGFFVCALATAIFVPWGGAHAADYSVLHTFTGPPGDGGNPWSDLIEDKAGNLYGTTLRGGSTDYCGGRAPLGCGTVFKLAPDGSETVLHAFTGQPDGAYPSAGLVSDKGGNVYGTTGFGGAYNKGTVFEIAKNGSESVLYSFEGKHGVRPAAGLIVNEAGDLFGTTAYGGDRNCPQRVVVSGCGTVFRLAQNGTETVLHAFAGAGEGNEPEGGLIMDPSGNIYGTTELGGDGAGNVFKLAPDGTETVLYTFHGKPDAARPSGSLMMDGAGNLYGAAAFGGNSCWFSVLGCGAIFKLEPNGNESVLYTFAAGGDGFVPDAGLVADDRGNLYGTTLYGGNQGCSGDGCGTVFRLAPSGKETVLHAFNGRDGYEPGSNLLFVNGRLYGTASSGFACGRSPRRGCGSVFELQK